MAIVLFPAQPGVRLSRTERYAILTLNPQTSALAQLLTHQRRTVWFESRLVAEEWAAALRAQLGARCEVVPYTSSARDISIGDVVQGAHDETRQRHAREAEQDRAWIEREVATILRASQQQQQSE
jgi:hypothetical protein